MASNGDFRQAVRTDNKGGTKTKNAGRMPALRNGHGVRSFPCRGAACCARRAAGAALCRAFVARDRRVTVHRAPKRKSPDWRRGTLSYGDKSTRLVIAVSSEKSTTCKLLKSCTLACRLGAFLRGLCVL